jgi:hypothetical protein
VTRLRTHRGVEVDYLDPPLGDMGDGASQNGSES